MGDLLELEDIAGSAADNGSAVESLGDAARCGHVLGSGLEAFPALHAPVPEDQLEGDPLESGSRLVGPPPRPRYPSPLPLRSYPREATLPCIPRFSRSRKTAGGGHRTAQVRGRSGRWRTVAQRARRGRDPRSYIPATTPTSHLMRPSIANEVAARTPPATTLARRDVARRVGSKFSSRRSSDSQMRRLHDARFSVPRSSVSIVSAVYHAGSVPRGDPIAVEHVALTSEPSFSPPSPRRWPLTTSRGAERAPTTSWPVFRELRSSVVRSLGFRATCSLTTRCAWREDTFHCAPRFELAGCLPGARSRRSRDGALTHPRVAHARWIRSRKKNSR